MSGAKEIRNQIRSVKNTQKITYAMEMVAASKMRKAQDLMLASRPYAAKIKGVISHLASSRPEYHHPFMQVRDVKKVGYIVISTDRGLCGGLNNNLFKALLLHMRQWQEQGAESHFCLIGSKANLFFKRYGGNILGHASHLGDKPKVTDLIGVAKVMLDAYAAAEIDRLYVVYNDFVNTMVQNPQVQQLLPLSAKEEGGFNRHWDYIYEPDVKELLDGLLMRYIEAEVYQAVIENLASEQAARMLAMKNASDNAGDFIDDLQLIYNKARQAAITQELAEIVAGAAAV